jgi:vacuolar-type H+-ATPase subunit F/Vma7
LGAAIFIGDEVTATGFRLTGIETIVPAPEDAGATLDDARARAALVIMTAELAANVPAAKLEAAMLAETPALAIVPDARFHVGVPDLAWRLRRVLGIES